MLNPLRVWASVAVRLTLAPISVIALGAGVMAAGTGCESHAGNAALIGGAAGAGIGAIIGHNSHDRAGEGALIGGAAGAIGGALIGNEMDKKEAREADRLDVRVALERPGEAGGRVLTAGEQDERRTCLRHRYFAGVVSFADFRPTSCPP